MIMMDFPNFAFGFVSGCLFTALAAGMLAARLLAPYIKQASKNQQR